MVSGLYFTLQKVQHEVEEEMHKQLYQEESQI